MKKVRETVFDVAKLREDLRNDARAVGMADGVAEDVAEKVAERVTDWATKRSIITQDDLHRKIAQEATKYSKDLAYVYQNRGKII